MTVTVIASVVSASRTVLASLTATVTALLVAATPARAHVGALGGPVEANPVPFWLVVLTGGGAIGASFLFTSLVTDHATIREVNEARLSAALSSARFPTALPAPRRVALWGIRTASVALLALVVVVGLVGPRAALRNAAVLFVWVGWWAGYTMSTYLVADTWPVLNPWRALAVPLSRLRDALGVRERTLPAWGAWPSVVGLLGLVFLEVVTPIAEDPRLLAIVVLGYSAATLAGAVAFGADAWFDRVDPVARVFRLYGRMAPVQRTESGLTLRLPGSALAAGAERDGARDAGSDATHETIPDTADGWTHDATDNWTHDETNNWAHDETAFVVALLWATTFDGLVSTPAWNAVARALVGRGVPALALYLAVLVVGFALFLAVYRRATRLVRRSADSYVAPSVLRARFAPSLVPIAAGYHLAHFLGYFLTLLPALVAVAQAPFSPPTAIPTLVIPGWFSSLALAFVLLGHVVAVWVAHGVAFDLFTGRLQPIRSQYPLAVVMVFYTMTSTWIVAQPLVPPAGV